MGRRTGTRIIALAIVAVLQVDATAAQWPNQTPGIPRRADGKVDLTAPAPRAADGKPDLSGTWRFSGKNYVDDVKLPPQPWAETLARQRAEGDGKDDPTAQCLSWYVGRP